MNSRGENIAPLNADNVDDRNSIFLRVMKITECLELLPYTNGQVGGPLGDGVA
jgi:hypothetical protein